MPFPARLWPNDSWQSEKTVYDPCPAGWRVPDGGENSIWAKALKTIESFYDKALQTESGLKFSGALGADDMIYYPASGYRVCQSSLLSAVGLSGYYWSCTLPMTTGPGFIYVFYFDCNGEIGDAFHYNNDSDGYPVRCLKE